VSEDAVVSESASIDPVTFRPIGVVRSPYVETAGMPVQAVAAAGVRGRIELDPACAEGLAGIEGFSHLVLIYHLHRITESRLTVTPFLGDEPHGIFATRSPARPNPIGLSTVRLVGVEGTTLHIEELDLVDGTPLLDIKPYVPAFDDRAGARIGWFEGRTDRVTSRRADDRFR
jgi:tRNA (adenine37-N6)-methyltransferase